MVDLRCEQTGAGSLPADSDVVRVVDQRRFAADQFGFGIADDLAVAPVDLDETLVERQMRDTDRRLLERRAKALLGILRRIVWGVRGQRPAWTTSGS